MTDLPTRPWSPIEIEVKLAQVITLQDDASTEVKKYVDRYAKARREYEITKNQAILRSRVDRPDLKTDAQRLAWATIEAADARFAKDIAEGEMYAQRDVAKTLISQSDGLRSLARSSRDLTDQPGFGGQ